MSLGLVGKKCGMTRVFTEDGQAVPVTVVEVVVNKISQIKTHEKDGYYAAQIAYGLKRSSLLNKTISGHLAKAKCESSVGLHEFRLSDDATEGLELGLEVKVDQFTEGQFVDVSGVSKGKGYAGVIKRYNFSMQDATHGNSVSHRAPGSTGQCQTPGRVFKGKKMAGQMGNEKVTIQNLKVVRVDTERGLILISGPVPGRPGGYVAIRLAAKKKQEKK